MSRGVSSGMASAATQGNVPAVMFVEMDLDSGALRLCTTGEPIDWNGYTWTGAASIGSVDAIEETDTGEPKAIQFTLSGVTTGFVSTALSENIQGRTVKLWLAFCDPSTYQMVNTPLMVFDGRLDVMTVEVGETATVTVSAESREVDQRRPREYRYNHETQQAFHPGDMFFQYQAQLQDTAIVWGRKS